MHRSQKKLKQENVPGAALALQPDAYFNARCADADTAREYFPVPVQIQIQGCGISRWHAIRTYYYIYVAVVGVLHIISHRGRPHAHIFNLSPFHGDFHDARRSFWISKTLRSFPVNTWTKIKVR